MVRAARPRSFLRLLCVALILLFVQAVISQDPPREIRGYKAQRAEIAITSNDPEGLSEEHAFVKFGKLEVSDVALAGITFAMPAEIRTVAQSGRVDFLTFHDFRVNGMPVEIEDFNEPFSFSKGETIALPKPAQIFLPTAGVIKTAWNEIKESKKEWRITGRVFVFGKFRKMGFYFRRVVPVNINIVVKNPLLDKST